MSNQSLQGVLARLGEPGRPLWASAVLPTPCVGAWRVRRAATGTAACPVRPVSWAHHLVRL
ncbi:hypothetical protein [Streptomyces sp. SCL15-4]|uniref:hypothetical protein n=1 Tax=Streptomyces sp. SCL15-4 TaxID=2967221 RepID=UPI0029668924|nr:hypothetical protein [Streptomyces sp. SCL15-4]